jgi:anti-anti-sigma regulatory factor
MDNVSSNKRFFISGITVEVINDTVNIALPENFNYLMQAEFRQSYEKFCPDKSKKFVINYAKVKHMDSAALGMLLLMYDEMGLNYKAPVHDRVVFKECSPGIKDIFKIANFQDLFSIT